MQYLPEDLFWRILKNACGRSSRDLPESVGPIKEFVFWDHLDATGTSNSKMVEPDVLVESEEYDIIVEAKRSDNSADNSQNEQQWSNQIIALRNSYDDESPKPLIYIAIGGNESLKDSSVVIDGQDYVIHTASWYNLLNCVLNELMGSDSEPHPAYIRRVLQDIIRALQVHRFIKTTWFDSLPRVSISEGTDSALNKFWDFDNQLMLAAINQQQITNELDLQRIWTIAK